MKFQIINVLEFCLEKNLHSDQIKKFIASDMSYHHEQDFILHKLSIEYLRPQTF